MQCKKKLIIPRQFYVWVGGIAAYVLREYIFMNVCVRTSSTCMYVYTVARVNISFRLYVYYVQISW